MLRTLSAFVLMLVAIGARAVDISTANLPTAVVSKAYSVTLTAANAAGPVTWSLSSGVMPGGLTLDAATGVISGSPSSPGVAALTVQANDGVSSSIPVALTLNVTTEVGIQIEVGRIRIGTGPVLATGFGHAFLYDYDHTRSISQVVWTLPDSTTRAFAGGAGSYMIDESMVLTPDANGQFALSALEGYFNGGKTFSVQIAFTDGVIANGSVTRGSPAYPASFPAPLVADQTVLSTLTPIFTWTSTAVPGYVRMEDVGTEQQVGYTPIAGLSSWTPPTALVSDHAYETMIAYQEFESSPSVGRSASVNLTLSTVYAPRTITFGAGSADWSSHPFRTPAVNASFHMQRFDVNPNYVLDFTRYYTVADLSYGGTTISAICETSDSGMGVSRYWMALGSDGAIYNLADDSGPGSKQRFQYPPTKIAASATDILLGNSTWHSATAADISEQAPAGYQTVDGSSYVVPGVGFVQEGDGLVGMLLAMGNGTKGSVTYLRDPLITLFATQNPGIPNEVTLTTAVKTSPFLAVDYVSFSDGPDPVGSVANATPYATTFSAGDGTHTFTATVTLTDGSSYTSPGQQLVINGGGNGYFNFNLARLGLASPDGTGEFYWSVSATAGKTIAWSTFTMADGSVYPGKVENGNRAKIDAESLGFPSWRASLTGLVAKVVPGTYSVLIHYSDNSEETRSGTWNDPSNFPAWVVPSMPAANATNLASIAITWPDPLSPTVSDAWWVQVRAFNGTSLPRGEQGTSVTTASFIKGGLPADQPYTLSISHGMNNGTATGGFMSLGNTITTVFSTGGLPVFATGSDDFSNTPGGAWSAYTGVSAALTDAGRAHVAELAQVISPTDTVFQLTAPVEDGSLLDIGGEMIRVTARTGRQVTVLRGQLGTTAASHPLLSQVDLASDVRLGTVSQSHDSIPVAGSSIATWKVSWTVDASRWINLWFAKATDNGIYLVQFAEQYGSRQSTQAFDQPMLILPQSATTGSQFYFGDEETVQTATVNTNDYGLGSGVLATGGATYFIENGVGLGVFNVKDFTLVRSSGSVLTPQTISFPTIPDQSYAGTPLVLPLSATASSGLPVTFTVVGGPGSVSGTTLTINGTGSVTINATQAGDGTWAPAATSQTVLVTAFVAALPTVSSSAPAAITATAAFVSGAVTNDGGAVVSERGYCWSMAANPTIADSKKVLGSGVGSFGGYINGLLPDQTYYVRAYATNSVGTSYGAQMTLKTVKIDYWVFWVGHEYVNGIDMGTARLVWWMTTERPVKAAVFTIPGKTPVAADINSGGTRVSFEMFNAFQQDVVSVATLKSYLPNSPSLSTHDYSCQITYVDGSSETRRGSFKWSLATDPGPVVVTYPAHGGAAALSGGAVTASWQDGLTAVHLSPVNGTVVNRQDWETNFNGIYNGVTGPQSAVATPVLTPGQTYRMTFNRATFPQQIGENDLGSSQNIGISSLNNILFRADSGSALPTFASDSGDLTATIFANVPGAKYVGGEDGPEGKHAFTMEVRHDSVPLTATTVPGTSSLVSAVRITRNWNDGGKGETIWLAKDSNADVYMIRRSIGHPSSSQVDDALSPALLVASATSSWYRGEEALATVVSSAATTPDLGFTGCVQVRYAWSASEFEELWFKPGYGPVAYREQLGGVVVRSWAVTAPAISFPQIPTQVAGTTIPLNATCSIPLGIQFRVQSGPATVSGSDLTLTAGGTVVVVAEPQPQTLPAISPPVLGYRAPTPVTMSFSVLRAAQTIPAIQIPTQIAGTVIPLVAESSAKLPVTFSVLSGPAVIAGQSLSLTGAGVVEIAASQDGDATYLPAPRVVVRFSVMAAGDGSLPSTASLPRTTRRVGPSQTISIPVTLSVARSSQTVVTLAVTGNDAGLVAGSDYQIGTAIFPAGTNAAKASMALTIRNSAAGGITRLAISIVGIQGGGQITPDTTPFTVEVHDPAAAAGQPLSLYNESSAVPWQVGGTYRVNALNGAGSYTFGVSAEALVAPQPALTMSYDVDQNGTLDTGRPCAITPKVAGDLTVSVVDGAGAVQRFTVSVVAPSARAARPEAANVAVSARQETTWRTLAPSTLDGVREILSKVAGRANTEVQAWCFDPLAQDWIDLTKGQPAGGLTPGMGIYLATRIDLGLTLSGGSPEIPPRIPLQPRWNLVGIPSFSVGGQPVSSVSWSDFDVRDEDGMVLGSADALPELVGVPYLWNGQTFTRSTTLEVGRGYCIRNSSDEPPRPLTLTYRSKNAVAAIHVRDRDGSVGLATREVGDPPAPSAALTGEGSAPVASGQAEGSGGGCGLGSGVGLVLGSLALIGYRRRRAA